MFSKDSPPNGLKKELDIAIALARQAGDIAQRIRDKGYGVREKKGGLGPVTEADEAASDLLVQKISQAFPDDLIVSEEEPLSHAPSLNNRIWFIDPIDGTKEFIAGRADWSVMLGLAINGIPCVGVVYQPDIKQLYYATKGGGSFSCLAGETQNLKVRSISDPRNAILIQSRSHGSVKVDQIARECGISKTISSGSVGVKLGMIAAGHADLYFNFSGHCHLWDLCGPEIILQEAGGRILSADGKKIRYKLDEMIFQQPFLVSNTALLAKLGYFLI